MNIGRQSLRHLWRRERLALVGVVLKDCQNLVSGCTRVATGHDVVLRNRANDDLRSGESNMHTDKNSEGGTVSRFMKPFTDEADSRANYRYTIFRTCS